jgi:hypothetical protein
VRYSRHRRLPRCLLALIPILAMILAAGAHGVPLYPVRKSANQRFLVDQNGAPYLVVGDSPQALIVNISEADAEMFLANRSSHGFNSVWINLLCTTYTGGRPDGSTLDGIAPFTQTLPETGSYDLETPNEVYFAHVDRILDLAAGHGIQVILDPIETGGWLATMRDNGSSRCRAYGRYLGMRYESFDNIIWMSGNDFQSWRDPADDAVVREVALGILECDTRHLHTLELDYLVSSSLDDARWVSILGLNATYTYFPTYARLRQDYNRSYFLPNFMVEANYEFESLQGPITTAPILRKQEYWTMTSGATGQLYGNGYTWPFLAGWQSHLDTPGATQVGYLKTLFEPRAWYELVPDTSHVVVTSGYGVYSSTGYVDDNDYLTAASTANGALAIIYTPVVRTFTVDMERFGAAVTTRWFDPSSGIYQEPAGSPFPNTGTRDFATPGNNADGDGGWVLVLETDPPETQPPVVSILSPDSGAVVSDTVQVAASAWDSVGVEGVQFQLDGADLGAEDPSPPYAIAWNTLTAANGLHVVRAIARDLAGNRGADSVSVTVQNAIVPPPVDHLALAYAFDESGGTSVADSSGNGNTGTVYGANFGPGHHGHALDFDGLNAYLETPNSASLDIEGTGLTVAFWVYINATSSGVDYVIVDKPWNGSSMTSPFYQYGVEYSNGGARTLDFYFGDAGGGLHGPHRMSAVTGAWAHVAFTYDGSMVRGYLDGLEELSESDSGSLVPRGYSLRLGVDGAYHQFFSGAVDDLRIYSRALTPPEIRSAMLTAVGGGGTTAVPPSGIAKHGGPALSAAVPNPEPGIVRVAFTLTTPGTVELAVFDPSGRRVRTLIERVMPAGHHVAEWNGVDARGQAVPSGRYFVRLRAGGLQSRSTVVLLR